MINKIFSRFFTKSKSNSSLIGSKPEADSISEKKEGVYAKIENTFYFLSNKTTDAKNEFFSIREKCKNLRQTNYNLGLKHLEKGNLSDAIFRFRFIKKFWPDYYEAYYQLAYCFILNKKPRKAKFVLQELLIRQPNYDDTHEQKTGDLMTQAEAMINHYSSDASL